MTKYVLSLLGGLALIIGLTCLIDFRSRPRVILAPVAEQSRAVYAPGRVEGASENVELRVRAAGQLVARRVVEGQLVDAGDVLLQIDDDEPRQQRELADAELAVAQSTLERLKNGYREHEKEEATALWEAKAAELRRAELNWQRTSGLLQAKASSAQEADHQRAEVNVLTALVAAAQARRDLLHVGPREEDVRIAQAHVQSARARLGLAQTRLDRTRLIAPAAGRVLKLNVQVGELVGPDASEPAVVLCDVSRLRVRAFLEEFEALRVRPGDTATITADGLTGASLRGVVSHLAPQMSSKRLWSDHATERIDTRVREVWINLDAAGDMVPGLPVEVSIESAAPSNPLAQRTQT